MNGTIGRGTTVHSLTASYATCGKGMGSNSVSKTTAPVTCKTCIKLTAPVEHSYEITYRKNTLNRGWVTKTAIYQGTEEQVTKVLNNMIKSSGFQLISSTQI